MSALVCQQHQQAILIEDHELCRLVCSQCCAVVGVKEHSGLAWQPVVLEAASDDAADSVADTADSFVDAADMGGGDSRVADSADVVDTADKIDLADCAGAEAATARGSHEPSVADKQLALAFSEIARMGAELRLQPSVLKSARELFRQVQQYKLNRCYTKGTFASACLYLACRQQCEPRTLNEISGVSRSNRKLIGKAFKKIAQTLDTGLAAMRTEDFLCRFCADLQLHSSVKLAAVHIAEKSSQVDELASRSPVSIAAAAVYMACLGSSCRQDRRRVSEVAGISDNTVASVYKVMRQNARSLFPPSFAMQIDLLPWQ